MERAYLDTIGNEVPVTTLQLETTQEIVNAIERNPYTMLIECRQTSTGREVVVFDATVELGQQRTHDIRRVERIAIDCDPTAPSRVPDVLALRPDFPLVPHVNARSEAYPRNLCIFEESPDEVRLSWSAPRVIERIRRWLSLTARGELHAADQPLEPLLPPSLYQLVIPEKLFSHIKGSEFLQVHRVVNGGNDRATLIVARPDESLSTLPEYVATLIVAEPQIHGVIASAPRTLADLHNYLVKVEVDLIGELRERLKGWKRGSSNITILKLIIVVGLPKQREAEGLTETTEIRAFVTNVSIRDVGIDIGIWNNLDNDLAELIGVDETKQGNGVPLTLLNLHFTFSREMALRLSGLELDQNQRIVLVGTGALGSQMFINLVRMGYGGWVLVDNDIFLPHNLSRHALTEEFVGYPKVLPLAFTAQRILGDDQGIVGLVEDVTGLNHSPELTEALATADVILDVSTSIPAARHLVHSINSSARRISLFLNPRGTDLVLLAEDQQRHISLDLVEMQYYRYLLRESRLKEHLQGNSEGIRYAASCRDISATLPQDLIALHAATAARAIRKVEAHKESLIWLWQTDNDLGLSSMRYSVSPGIKHVLGEWTLYTDQGFIDTVNSARLQKLPNETGGVLIGSYDMQRKIVYVVDTILSPPDSQEWPNLYIRGYDGLAQAMAQVKQVTANRLTYIGEWHSHPRGVGCQPSSTDRQAFTWLSDIMQNDGFPPLMLIVGDKPQYGFFLNNMEK